MTSPTEPSDSLDELLAAAEWPRVSVEAQQRLLAEAIAAERPARQLRHRLIPLAAAAAIMAGVGIAWWSVESDAPPPVATESPTEPATKAHELEPIPQVEPPRLAGRPARDWELALMRQPTKRTSEPERSPSEIVAASLESPQSREALDALLALNARTRDELLLSALIEGEVAAGPLLAATALPATRYRLLWEAEWYDPEAQQWQRRPAVIEALTQALSARALLEAIESGEFANRDGAALAALVRSRDPQAARMLLEAARLLPEEARLAISEAPEGSAGVAGLVQLLQEPRIAVRREAAWMLAASSDPAVIAPLRERIADAGTRREALLVLLWSERPQWARLLRELETGDTAAALTIRSLRLSDPQPPTQNTELVGIEGNPL